MANEAVIIGLVNGGEPISMTVSDGTGIEKGAVLALIDPRTAALATAPTDCAAGIAAAEKVASDGSTRLAVWTNGIFDLKASGAIVIGELVKPAGENKVQSASYVDVVQGRVMGRALETAADLEVIAVRVII